MNQYTENLLDSDLQEVLSNDPAPDLTAKAMDLLARSRGVRDGLAVPGASEVAPPDAPIHKYRAPIWRRYAPAASILLVLGMVAWLMTRPDPLPRSVTASEGAQLRVRPDHIELKQGWVLLSDGAPALVIGVGRVEQVRGRAVAGLGIPDGPALDPLADQLQLSANERDAMKNPKRWITAGVLALCVLSGQALFNGQVVIAEEEPPPPVERAEIPKPEDGPAVRALFDSVASIELRVRTDARLSGWLKLSDELTVRAIANGFRDGLMDESEAPAGWIHQNEFELRLKDGRVIEASVYMPKSVGSGKPTYMADLRLPGWKRYYQFDCSTTLQDVIRPHLAEAAKKDRLPVQDAAAMRDLLSRATSAEFVDSTDAAKSISGTISNAKDLAAMAGLLWPEDMSFSKSHEPDRYVYNLTLKLNDGSTLAFTIGNTGIFDLVMSGESPVQGHILPDASIKSLHEMFVRSAAPTAFKVLREWTGSDSRITKRGSRIVTDNSAWTALWDEHTPREADERVQIRVPEVDFNTEIVLAVFAGDSWNSRGFYVRELLQGRVSYTVRVDEVTYQTMGPDGGGVAVRPFGIFVLPRTDAAITVEENVQSMIGEPPVWKQLEAQWKPKSDIEAMVSYVINGARLGTGGAGKDQFLVARNKTEWSDLFNDIGAGEIKAAPVDWDRYIAVAATGTALKGLGNFELVFNAQSAKRVVLRLTTPIAQTEGEPQYESIWRIWLLPKPTTEVVVETPVYGMIDDPIKWKEAHTIKP